MKAKRRFIAAAIAILMLLTLFPGVFGADAPVQTKTMVLNTGDGKFYIDSAEAEPGVNYGGLYSYNNGVLILDGFTYTSTADTGIQLEDDVSIVLYGENVIISDVSDGVSATALYVEGDVSISGDGSLTLKAYSDGNNSALYTDSLTLESGSLICEAGDSAGGKGSKSLAIFSDESAVVVKGGYLLAKAGSAATSSAILDGSGADSIAVPEGYSSRSSSVSEYEPVSGTTFPISGAYIELMPTTAVNSSSDNTAAAGSSSTVTAEVENIVPVAYIITVPPTIPLTFGSKDEVPVSVTLGGGAELSGGEVYVTAEGSGSGGAFTIKAAESDAYVAYDVSRGSGKAFSAISPGGEIANFSEADEEDVSQNFYVKVSDWATATVDGTYTGLLYYTYGYRED